MSAAQEAQIARAVQAAQAAAAAAKSSAASASAVVVNLNQIAASALKWQAFSTAGAGTQLPLPYWTATLDGDDNPTGEVVGRGDGTSIKVEDLANVHRAYLVPGQAGVYNSDTGIGAVMADDGSLTLNSTTLSEAQLIALLAPATGPLLLDPGTPEAPAYSFSASPGDGISTDLDLQRLNISVHGARVAYFYGNGLVVTGGHLVLGPDNNSFLVYDEGGTVAAYTTLAPTASQWTAAPRTWPTPKASSSSPACRGRPPEPRTQPRLWMVKYRSSSIRRTTKSGSGLARLGCPHN